MELGSKCAVTTTLAAAGGGIIGTIIGRLHEKHWNLPRITNGIITGLVSITAGCAVVSPGSSVAIGAIGAALYYGTSRYMERLEIDDCVDAFAVHGIGGMWGIFAVGIFANSENVAFAGYNEDLVNATRGGRLQNQIVGALIITAWTVVNAGLIWGFFYLIGFLRVPEEVEKEGLDKTILGKRFNLHSRGDSMYKDERLTIGAGGSHIV